MNYVIVALVAAPGYLLAFLLAYVLKRQSLDREAVEANLRTQVNDVLLKWNKLDKENGELTARDADLSEALEKTRVLYNKVLAKNAELIAENEHLQKRPARKKAVSE